MSTITKLKFRQGREEMRTPTDVHNIVKETKESIKAVQIINRRRLWKYGRRVRILDNR